MTSTLPSSVRRLLLLLYPLLLLIPALPLLGATPIFGDDHSSHSVAVHHLVSLLLGGDFDFFCPTFNLGFPMYLYYQPLPHLAPALLHLLSLGLIPVQAAFNLTVVLLFCAYPLAVYQGARWLRMGDAAALAAGALAPMVSSSLGFGFTIDSVMGAGLYTQTFAMVLLPLSLGSMWRHLTTGRGRTTAAGLLTLVFLSHAFYGVVAGTAGVVMALVRPGALRAAFPRLVLVSAAAVASLLFWLLPLLVTRDHMGGWPWGGQERWLGYGAARVAGELARGGLLDHGRTVPLLSLMMGGGVALAVMRWRREPAARALLVCLALFTFFLMGRRSFGHLVDIQPANLGLQLFRYLGAVHLLAVLLAGLGFGAALSWLGRRAPAMITLVAAAALLASPLLWFGQRGRALFRTMDSYSVKERDLNTLGQAVARARQAGAPPGRIYAHTKTGAGSHLVSALLARHTDQPMGQSYGVGLHDSLGFYYLEYLDPTDRARMALYNFRYLVATPGSPAARGLTPLRTAAGLGLYVLPGRYGYFMPLEEANRLRGAPRSEREATRQIMPVLGGGEVISEAVEPNSFSARVKMARHGVVALKVAHHPFWQVTVDGQPARLLRAAPVFLAAKVPAGEHLITFRFRNPLWQKVLLGLSLCSWLLALGLVYRRRRLCLSTGPEPEEPKYG